MSHSQPNCLWDFGIFYFFIYLDKETGAVLMLVAGIAVLIHVPLRRLLWKAGGACWSFQSGSVGLRRAGSETGSTMRKRLEKRSEIRDLFAFFQ